MFLESDLLQLRFVNYSNPGESPNSRVYSQSVRSRGERSTKHPQIIIILGVFSQYRAAAGRDRERVNTNIRRRQEEEDLEFEMPPLQTASSVPYGQPISNCVRQGRVNRTRGIHVRARLIFLFVWVPTANIESK